MTFLNMTKNHQRSYSYAKMFISAPSPRDLNDVTPSGGRRSINPRLMDCCRLNGRGIIALYFIALYFMSGAHGVAGCV